MGFDAKKKRGGGLEKGGGMLICFLQPNTRHAQTPLMVGGKFQGLSKGVPRFVASKGVYPLVSCDGICHFGYSWVAKWSRM